MEAYSAEDFENNHPLSFLGFGSSQFDKDRTEYVSSAGKYSDKNFFERTAESMKEEGLGNKVAEMLSVVLTRNKGGKVFNGVKNASKGMPHGDNGRAIESVQKRVAQLQKQLQTATKSEQKVIKKKIENIQRDAQRKQKGETHWRR
jgi:hypothetical protein